MAQLMKLPIFPTLIEAYRLFFLNLGVYARLIWIPAVAQFAAAVFARNYVPRLEAETSENLTLVVLGTLLGVIASILAVPAMTAWCRLVVLGRENREARLTYSVRAAEWRFFWRGAILVIAALIALLCVMVAVWRVAFATTSWDDFESQMMAHSILSCLILFMVLGLIVFGLARFMLVLPAAAIGQTLSFGSSWRITQGSGFQLGSIVALAVLPPYACYAILDYAFFGASMDASIDPVEYLLLSEIVYWFFFTIDMSVLGLAFRHQISHTASKAPNPAR